MKAPAILLFLALSIPLFSQGFYGGVGQHLGISTYTRGMVPWKFKFSSNTVLFTGYRLNDKFAFQTGIGYLIAGVKLEKQINGQYVDEIFRQDYLGIPMIVKYRMGRKGRFLPGAGGFCNIHLRHSVRTDPPGYSPLPIWENLDSEKDIFGLTLRPAFELPLYGKTLSIGLQQDVGITKFAAETRPTGTYLFIEYNWINLN